MERRSIKVNKIISGKYMDISIEVNTQKTLAYLKVFDKYITKHTVESVNILNSSQKVDGASAIKGAIIAGTVGAIIGSNPTEEILIEITWKDGGTSIAEVNQYVYKAIVAGMYTTLSEDDLKTVKREYESKIASDAADRSSCSFWIWVVVIIIIIASFFEGC